MQFVTYCGRSPPVLRFPPIKLTTTIQLKCYWNWCQTLANLTLLKTKLAPAQITYPKCFELLYSFASGHPLSRIFIRTWILSAHAQGNGRLEMTAPKILWKSLYPLHISSNLWLYTLTHHPYSLPYPKLFVTFTKTRQKYFSQLKLSGGKNCLHWQQRKWCFRHRCYK